MTKGAIYGLIFLIVALGCSSGGDRSDETGEFESFGTFRATVNGEPVQFSAAKARQYSSPFIQIVGRNCSKRLMIGFDIPLAEGTYNLTSLGDVFVFVQSASACPATNGGNSPQITLEAEVIITSFSQTRVAGNFYIVAGRDMGSEDYVISDGLFDVERE